MISNAIPFLLFILFFYVLSFIDTFSLKVNNDIKILFLLCSLCLLVIFAGGRWSSLEVGYDVGIFDYGTYKNIYNSPSDIFSFLSDYKDSSWEIRGQEMGYVFYSSLCYHLLGSNFNLYLLFTNFLLIVLFYKSLKRNDIRTGLFFILFFFAARLYLQYNFILLRQAIAMTIVWMWAFPFLLKDEKIKFCLFVGLATAFHYTALISLLALVMNRNLNIKYIIIAICFFFVLSITKVVDKILLIVIEKCLSVLGSSEGIGEKLSKYLLESEDGEFRGLNILTFIEAIPFIYIVRKYKSILYSSLIGRFYTNMFYIFILLLAITMNFGFLTRMCQYFIFSYFFLFSFFIKNAKSIAERRTMLFLFSNYLLIYSVRYIFIWFYSTEYSFFLFKL